MANSRMDHKTTPGQDIGQGPSLPTIKLPKGGGAIQNIGEKFGMSPVTGTGSFSIPISTTPARAVAPSLSLSYDSGSGNGPFGFGWSMLVPSITRKTSRGLPRYDETDIFDLSGADELVPQLRPDGPVYEDNTHLPGYVIRRYRPRTEGSFNRIERCTNVSVPDDVHWRVTGADNVLAIYGDTEKSRIVNPQLRNQIFSWLLSQVRDQSGNVAVYVYKPEDGTGIDFEAPHQQNRGTSDDSRRSANRYIKSIKYGNHLPLLDDAGNRPHFLPAQQLNNVVWLFEVLFDYGEHDELMPTPKDPGDWSYRPDAFSTYRSGFEIRTSRLCKRVLMFHHFEHESNVGINCLVRSLTLKYSHDGLPAQPNAQYSYLSSVTSSGYRRNNGTYIIRDMPPVEFNYSLPEISQILETVDEITLENLPSGLASPHTRFIDLYGEGISSLLTESEGTWYYKRNVSPLNTVSENGRESTKAMFEPTAVVETKPNSAGAEISNISGTGFMALVLEADRALGFFRTDGGFSWENLTLFPSMYNGSLNGSQVRFLDLTGDGLPDVVIASESVTLWYQCLSDDGYGPAEELQTYLAEEKGPQRLFSNDFETIYLSDFTGDGLSDIVRIRNRECCYWPNLGYGKFGPKVVLDKSPTFDHDDHFSYRRLVLIDADGSGTTDILYLGPEGPNLYLNQSGNGFSDPFLVQGLPETNSSQLVSVVDLLGNGTACIVISSDAPNDATQTLRYLRLMKEKPHLLIKMVNNLGASTEIKYTTSTKFYLQDKLAGTPWITTLPFPVHVVESVLTYDVISKNVFTKRYAYHHGHYDIREREFRGFGMVECWDSDTISALTLVDTRNFSNTSEETNLPPIHTKSWFHTGHYSDRSSVSRQYASEYYQDRGLSMDEIQGFQLPDTVLPPDITAEDEAEACRTLKGTALRSEVYCDDFNASSSLKRKARSKIPFSVTESNLSLHLVQSRGINQHAVFRTTARESFLIIYDRNPSDPRINHTIVLETGSHGEELRKLNINYGKAVADQNLTLDWDVNMQIQTSIIYTENKYTNAIDDISQHPYSYRLPMSCETTGYELTGFSSTPKKPFLIDFWTRDGFAMLSSAAILEHQADPISGAKQMRILSCTRTLYRKNNLTGFCPLSRLESLVLGGKTYSLAFTTEILNQYYRHNDQLLDIDIASLHIPSPNKGGYALGDELQASGLFPRTDKSGRYWIPSGESRYSRESDPVIELATARAHFYIPRVSKDLFNNETFVVYDNYDLLMLDIEDAIGNHVTAGERSTHGVISNAIDYRVMQPRLVTDMNRNISEAVFDAHGHVTATSISGKKGEGVGDTVLGIDPDPDPADIALYFQDPIQHAAGLLGRATTRIVYDLFAYQRTKNLANPSPAATSSLVRTTHDAGTNGGQTEILKSFSYGDGFDREIQRKVQVKPGPVPQRDSVGKVILDSHGSPVMTEHDIYPRWTTDGWTIFNNKGSPVRSYEPFFTSAFTYEFDVRVGKSPVLFYDAAQRNCATLYQNNTYLKQKFSAWSVTNYSVSDNVTNNPKTDPEIAEYTAPYFSTRPDFQTWYEERINSSDPDIQQAARNSTVYADTPSIDYLDSQGRIFLSIAHNKVVCADHELNGTQSFNASRTEFDAQGRVKILRDSIIQHDDKRGRIIKVTDYDMHGQAMHTVCAEKGDSWMLRNAAGQILKTWNNQGHSIRTEYDSFGRLVRSFISDEQRISGQPATKIQIARHIHGDNHPEAEERNLRGASYLVLDQASATTIERMDFKGNILETSTRFCSEYKLTVDLQPIETALPSNPVAPLDLVSLNSILDSILEPERFVSSSKFDALNREIQGILPHTPNMLQTAVRTVYELSSLVQIDANVREEKTESGLVWLPIVTAFQHDAKGQRQKVIYGNRVSTSYTYNDIFQLTNVETRRNQGGLADVLQDLSYVYEVGGSISKIKDASQQTAYFRNEVVEPSTIYIYDALGRLLQAKGRENLAQAGPPQPYTNDDSVRYGNLPADSNTMGRYTEQYVYDEVSNIRKMRHSSHTQSQGWSREFHYNELSRAEPSKTSNKLSSSVLRNDTLNYMYDEHGNMTRLPHLGGAPGEANIKWDFLNRMKEINLGGGGTAYYVYNQGGKRVRKVIEKTANLIEERLYFGPFEIYRKKSRGAILLERETVHIHDDSQLVALVESRTKSQGTDASPTRLIRFQLSNHLDSCCVEVDQNGRLLTFEEYSPYGSTTYQASTPDLETPKRFRFSGKERDEETGLSYHDARYLAPWLGRWISVDPGGVQDGPNLYSYVNGSPISLSDPSGQAGIDYNHPDRWSIDEVLEINANGISAEEAIQRALNAGNKRFQRQGDNNSRPATDPNTNFEETLAEPVSLTEAGGERYLLTKNFGNVKELREAVRIAVDQVVVKNPEAIPTLGANATSAERTEFNQKLRVLTNKINKNIKAALLSNTEHGRAFQAAAQKLNANPDDLFMIPEAPDPSAVLPSALKPTEQVKNESMGAKEAAYLKETAIRRAAAGIKEPLPEVESELEGWSAPKDSAKMSVGMGAGAANASLGFSTIEQIHNRDYAGLGFTAAVTAFSYVVGNALIRRAGVAGLVTRSIIQHMDTPDAKTAAEGGGLGTYKYLRSQNWSHENALNAGILSGVATGIGTAALNTVDDTFRVLLLPSAQRTMY